MVFEIVWFLVSNEYYNWNMYKKILKYYIKSEYMYIVYVLFRNIKYKWYNFKNK